MANWVWRLATYSVLWYSVLCCHGLGQFILVCVSAVSLEEGGAWWKRDE